MSQLEAVSTRFVVLGHGRTGSNLLHAAMRQHPRVRVFGELFHDSEEKRAQWPAAGLYWHTGEDPVPFLERTAYAPSPNGEILAAGFRIFYYHSKTDRRVWEYLADEDAVRVIHLSRRNLFETLVSRRVALLTGEWKRTASDAAPSPIEPFEIDPDACREYFDSITRYRAWARTHFAGHPMLELFYEDLVADFQPTLDRVFRFLGVDPVQTRMVYEKQARIPAREQVANYAHLLGAFRGSPYEGFFD
jgi:LPS sulfotransferase NodH